MSINNKLLIAISIVAAIVIASLGIFSTEEPKTSYESIAATPILEYKTNINTAEVDELTRLDGLGEKTAEAIVEYRKSNGNYKTVDELLNIKGIGEKKLDKWREFLCAE